MPVETVFSAVAVRILEGVDELLFSSGELRLALEAQARKMCDAIEAEPEESLKQAGVDEWAAALAHHFAVACPELQNDGVWREPVKDVKVDVPWDTSRYFSDPYSKAARNFPGTMSSERVGRQQLGSWPNLRHGQVNNSLHTSPSERMRSPIPTRSTALPA